MKNDHANLGVARRKRKFFYLWHKIKMFYVRFHLWCKIKIFGVADLALLSTVTRSNTRRNNIYLQISKKMTAKRQPWSQYVI